MRAALATVGLDGGRVTPVLGGWASWTFELDGRRIVRFPRTDGIADATRRELALLPELAGHLSYRVPEPSHIGEWNSRPFFAYRLIPGRGMRPTDSSPSLLDQLRGGLAELHSFPVDRAAELLATGPPEQAWRRHFERLWPIVEEHVLPVIEPSVADDVRTRFSAFVAWVDDVPSCLVHNDLGLEHLLVDPDRGHLTGIIDFEAATVGDPAIDLVPLWAAIGADEFAMVVQGRDLGDRLEERLHLYRWMGSVHAIIYGVTQGVEAELVNGRRELACRIAAAAGR
ncbi:MAG: aminoglycoside phosphotransferase family protein [Acidimicrobiales bacterium]